jgi:tripartite motif-containing protein 71
MAEKKNSKNKKKPEINEEKIVAIAFGITVAIIGIFMLLSNISIGPMAKELKTEVLGYLGNPGDLDQPFGIAVSQDCNFMYAANVNSNSIKKIRQLPDKTSVLESSWGGAGNKPGQFNQPSGLSMDRQGNVYVADAYNNRIQKFDSAGKFLSAIDLSRTGFWRPRNILVDASGTVYVANTGKENLYRFNTEGRMVGEIITFSGEVFGLAADSKGRIYVANLGDRSVEVFDTNFKSIQKIKIASWIPNKGLWPMIAVDSKDRLYAVSELENQVYVFDAASDKFKVIGVIKTDAAKRPLFAAPLGIAVDSQDNVYVSDKLKNRVVKVRPEFKQN